MNTKSKYIKTVKKNKYRTKKKQDTNINITSDILIDIPKTILQKKSNYSYDLSTVLETNIKAITNNITKIFVCVYIVINNNNRINIEFPYLQYLLFKNKKNTKNYSNSCIFPFILNKTKNYIETADKLVKDILDVTIKSDGFIQSNSNLYVL